MITEQCVPVAPLMELTTGFWAFKTLATAHELDLFTRLSDGGATPAEVSSQLGVPLKSAELLLAGCASLGLLDRAADRYVTTPLADTYLVAGCQFPLGGWITMLDRRLYPAWGRLPDAVRTGGAVSSEHHGVDLFSDPVMLETFWQGMHSVSSLTGKALAEAVDFTTTKRVLDVGGGSGAFDIQLCTHHPHLRATVFDLPHVTPIAVANIAAAGLTDQITPVPGDFFTDALPAGHDAILLSMIMHDWEEEQNLKILRKCHDALDPGGIVIISELLMNDDQTGPRPAALMSLNMLVEGMGRNYTATQYAEWLRHCGFTAPHTVPLPNAPGANGVVIAHKPR